MVFRVLKTSDYRALRLTVDTVIWSWLDVVGILLQENPGIQHYGTDHRNVKWKKEIIKLNKYRRKHLHAYHVFNPLKGLTHWRSKLVRMNSMCKLRWTERNFSCWSINVAATGSRHVRWRTKQCICTDTASNGCMLYAIYPVAHSTRASVYHASVVHWYRSVYAASLLV